MNHATAFLSSPTHAAKSTALTAPRVDLYAHIHKALRSFMSNTLARLGQLDVADASDMNTTLAQIEALMDLCASHLDHENVFVHTAINARSPAGATRTADDHVEHLQSIDALRAEAQALQAALVPQRPLMAQRLYRHLALFVAENFQHMHYEETVNNAALWAHYSDAELMQLHGRLLASIAPAEMLLVARWMVPALNPSERAALLGGMKAAMPPEAFLGIVEHVRPHLDQAAWAKLARAIGVAQQPGLVDFC
jgi:hypothetical protein